MQNKKLKTISLFDGLGIWKKALDDNNIENEYYGSEIDLNCELFCHRTYTNYKSIGDVNKVVFEDYEWFDLLIWGSPCQDMSKSNYNQKWLKWDRSGLLNKFVEAKRKIKPKNFLLENVVPRDKNDMQEITRLLGVDPILINSSQYSAQKRPRLYWTDIKFDNNIVYDITINDILEDIPLNSWLYIWPDKFWRIVGNVSIVKEATKKGYIMVGEWECFDFAFSNSKTRRGRSMFDKSNTVMTSNDFYIFKYGMVRKMTLLELERLQTFPDNFTSGFSDNVRKKMIWNSWTLAVIKQIFTWLK